MNDPQLNPYVGPRTFEEKDRQFFFGREREARDLLSLVIAEPLSLFYAQSGAGKSSLVNARLIPSLREEEFTVLPVARVSGALPEGILEVDNIFIFNLLLGLDQGRREAHELAKMSLSEYISLRRSELADEDEDAADAAIFLIVDQFEEIITTNLDRWTERETFFLQLRQAMRDDSLLWIMLTLREDYVAALDPFALIMPDRLRARFHMKRMGAAAAREAIEKPAANHGRPFAAGVAKTLVNNLRQIRVQNQTTVQMGEFVEPVQLQVVCYQLWQNLCERPLAEITQKDLDELGNVDKALSQFYEQAICAVLEQTHDSEIEMRNWFERQLITEAETRGTVYQGASETAGMPNKTVHLLESQFLLRAEIRAGGTWYELVHDRFVTPILQANQAWRLQQSPLIQAAEAWDRAERSRDLLYEGKQLKEALSAVNWETAEDIVKEFLTASQEAQSQQELEETRAIAEEQTRRAEAEARISRRLRRLTAALIIIFLIAASAAVVAYGASQEAQTAQATAEFNKDLAATKAVDAAEAAATAEFNEVLAEERAVEAVDAAATAQFNEELAATNADAAASAAATARYNEELAAASEQEAVTAKATAEANAAEAQRISRVSLAQALAALAPRTVDRTNDTELATLLALAAQWIDQGVGGGLEGFISSSLREVLTEPYFNTVLSDHRDWVLAVALSPDRQLLASASYDGEIRLWDLSQQSAPSRVLTADTADVHSLLFSSDGRKLAYINRQREIHLWDLSSDQPSLVVLSGPTAGIEYLAFGADEQTMMATTAQNEVVRWNLSVSPPSFASIVQRSAGNFIVGLSPDGETLVTAEASGLINLWNLTIPGAPRSRFLVSHELPVTTVAFTDDSRTLASVDEEGQIRIWDLEQGSPSPTRLFPLNSTVSKMSFSGDGQQLVSIASDVSDLAVCLFDLANPIAPPTPLFGHDSSVRDVTFSQDGLLIASGGEDRKIRLWDLTPSEAIPPTLRGHAAAVSSVVYRADGQAIYSGSYDGTIRAWAGDDPTNDSEVLATDLGQIRSLDVSVDGHLLAAVGDDAALHLWELDSAGGLIRPEPTTLANAHGSAIRTVSFSPDGTLLATAGVDAVISLWGVEQALTEPETVQPLAELAGHVGTVNAVTFSPDGAMLASAGEDADVLLWEVSQAVTDGSGQPSRRLLEHEDAIQSLAFSHDGRLLASAGNDLGILVWTLAEPDAEPYELDGHEDWILALAFSPDGKRLASAGWDQTVRLWDLTRLRESETDQVDPPTILIGHTSVVRDVAYSPNGNQLVSASDDRTVRLWQASVRAFADIACTQVRRNMSWEEWERNVGGEPYQRLCTNLPVHPSFIESARSLAGDGDINGAIGRFSYALELDPTLDIDPKLDAAAAMVEGSVDVAEDGEIELALSRLRLAQTIAPEISIQPDQWTDLCQLGVRYEMAAQVTDACQNAVNGALATDDLELNLILCQTADQGELLEILAPACERAADLVSASEAVYLNYLVCQASLLDALADLLAPACDQTEALSNDIAIGQTVAGELESERDDLWLFEGAEGQVVSVELLLESDEQAADLLLLGPDGSEIAVAEESDVSSDIRISSFTLPATDLYAIWVESAAPGPIAYQLRLLEIYED